MITSLQNGQIYQYTTKASKMKVQIMQQSGTEAIRPQLQPLNNNNEKFRSFKSKENIHKKSWAIPRFRLLKPHQ